MAEFSDRMDDARELTELVMDASKAELVEMNEDAAAPEMVLVDIMSLLVLVWVRVVSWAKACWAARRATTAKICFSVLNMLRVLRVLDWRSVGVL